MGALAAVLVIVLIILFVPWWACPGSLDVIHAPLWREAVSAGWVTW